MAPEYLSDRHLALLRTVQHLERLIGYHEQRGGGSRLERLRRELKNAEIEAGLMQGRIFEIARDAA